MPVLRWDKPKKARSKADWENYAGFEEGPTGGYVPNMSEADAASWKAKLVGHTKGRPQVEIRRQCGPSLLLVIVNLGTGYNYKQYVSDTDLDVYKTGEEYDAAMIAEEEERDRQTPPRYRRHYSMADYYRDNPTTDAALKEMQSQACTRDINVHMSMNGPAQMTFEVMAELNEAVLEAKLFLEELVAKSSG